MNTKKKITSILWAFAYFAVLVCALISSTVIFHNNYFSLVYVDGVSMQPTLNNNGVTEFGIVDKHSSAINNIQRFDIITTYYPIKYNSSTGSLSDYSYIAENGKEIFTDFTDPDHEVHVSSTASFKIKRVIALPGEQFKVQEKGVEIRTKNEDGSWGDSTFYEYTFKHKYGDKTNDTYRTLGEDEYWVLGDNWGSSLDSNALNMKVLKDNIQGVLVAIEGTCKVVKSNGKIQIKNKKYYNSFKFF